MSRSYYEECNGLGTIPCFCGGDLCVCEWYGEIPCDGCEACRPRDPNECFYHPTQCPDCDCNACRAAGPNLRTPPKETP